MKKILLLLVVIFLAITSFSQENPCPTVSGIRRTNIVNNGNGTCSASITLHITNDVSQNNPKGVQVEVLCNSSVVLTECFIASNVPGGADYTTTQFTCPCNATLTIRITRFTASNGNCQGGTCGNIIIIEQSPLPVEFNSFTAARSNSAVILKWETAMEKNNSGFAIERNVNGSWQQIGWLPTQALNGNSDALLTYTYMDNNNIKGISQYRIRQVDFDARSTFSAIRSVRGEGQLGKTIVYPNPSNNGKVNVVFEDASVTREIAVTDMSGRMVRQMKGITNNNITIENLNPGMYTIRIVAIETGEQVVEKIVVNKR